MHVPTNTLIQPHVRRVVHTAAHTHGCTSSLGVHPPRYIRVSVQKFPVLTVLRMKRMPVCVCVLGVGDSALLGPSVALLPGSGPREMLH